MIETMRSRKVQISILFLTAEVFGEVHFVEIERIVDRLRSWQQEKRQDNGRPWVTACFATSVDGKLAPFDQKGHTTGNYPLSGPESQQLTHALRASHDGILVGGRTLECDNPRLNNRLWSAKNDKQPIPIVLDTHLNHIEQLKECRAADENTLLVCCCDEAADSLESLPSANVLLVPCRQTVDGRLDLDHVLEQLKTRFGIETLMLEGGAQLLSSFFLQGLVDAVCITIAPVLLSRGIAPSYGGKAVRLEHLEFVPLGRDCAFLSKWHADASDLP